MSCERARTALGTFDAPSMGGSHCSRKMCGRQTPAAVSSVMQLRHLTGTCRLTCPRPAVPPCSVDSSSRHTGHTAWQVDSGGIFSCSRPLAGGLRTVHRLAIAPHIRKKREIPLALPSECTKNQLLITFHGHSADASHTSYPVSQHSLPENRSRIQQLLTTSSAETRLSRIIFSPDNSSLFHTGLPGL